MKYKNTRYKLRQLWEDMEDTSKNIENIPIIRTTLENEYKHSKLLLLTPPNQNENERALIVEQKDDEDNTIYVIGKTHSFEVKNMHPRYLKFLNITPFIKTVDGDTSRTITEDSTKSEPGEDFIEDFFTVSRLYKAEKTDIEREIYTYYFYVRLYAQIKEKFKDTPFGVGFYCCLFNKYYIL